MRVESPEKRNREEAWQTAPSGYFTTIRAFPIEVEEGGRLRLPGHVSVPAHARLAVLVLENAGEGNDDLTAVEDARLAEAAALGRLSETGVEIIYGRWRVDSSQWSVVSGQVARPT